MSEPSGPDETLDLPRKLSYYELKRLLGRGGMGAVYMATDSRTQGTVAVKLMHPNLAEDTNFRARFEREAYLASSLSSLYTVRLLDYDFADGAYFIVMEYVEGQTLRDVLYEDGRLKPERALHITIQVGRALESAHRLGIVHRDIKPENILVRSGDRVKVMDFGIARELEHGTFTLPGGFVGTLTYAAPEQVAGKADNRSDIYALGAVLYEMLAARPPFLNGVMELFHPDTKGPPLEPLASAPAPLVEVALRCLQKDPPDRYDRASALVIALERAAREMAMPDVLPLSATDDYTRGITSAAEGLEETEEDTAPPPPVAPPAATLAATGVEDLSSEADAALAEPVVEKAAESEGAEPVISEPPGRQPASTWPSTPAKGPPLDTELAPAAAGYPVAAPTSESEQPGPEVAQGPPPPPPRAAEPASIPRQPARPGRGFPIVAGAVGLGVAAAVGAAVFLFAGGDGDDGDGETGDGNNGGAGGALGTGEDDDDEDPEGAGTVVALGDDFDDPRLVEGLPFEDQINAAGATSDSDDPIPQCGNENTHTVWYALSLEEETTLEVDTSGSDYDTVVSVFTGDLEEVACNDDVDEESGASNVSFPAEADRSYYILVAAFEGEAGSLEMRVSERADQGNDDFEFARRIDDLPFSDRTDTTGATTADDDPIPPCGGSAPLPASVWYEYTPDSDETVIINTEGSSYDTVVTAYLGEPPDLNEVACNAGAEDLAAVLFFTPIPDATYHIFVSGVESQAGGSLNLLVTAGDYDEIRFARPIRGTIEALLDTSEATRADDDPISSCGSGQNSATVWWGIISAVAGDLTVDTSGSDYDTVVTVWLREPDGTFAEVSCNDGDGNASFVSAPIQALGSYYVEVAASGDDLGGVLNISITPP